jgi:predicted lipoprotein with Yx(FWY)xxD motif
MAARLARHGSRGNSCVTNPRAAGQGGMRTLIVTIALASVALLAPEASMSDPAAAAADRATLTAKSSRFGRIVFDGRGYVLYAFTADARARSNCYGACAAAWPPYIVSTRPKRGAGITGVLGTVRRRDGRLQGTLDGRPLYYYVGDRRPGLILCQNVREFGGLWLVVRPSGAYVR